MKEDTRLSSIRNDEPSRSVKEGKLLDSCVGTVSFSARELVNSSGSESTELQALYSCFEITTSESGCTPRQTETATDIQPHFHRTATEQNTCSHMIRCAPGRHNWDVTAGRIGKGTEKQARMSVSREVCSRPPQLTTAKKYL